MVMTVPIDGIASSDPRASAGTVTIKFGSRLCAEPTLECLNAYHHRFLLNVFCIGLDT